MEHAVEDGMESGGRASPELEEPAPAYSEASYTAPEQQPEQQANHVDENTTAAAEHATESSEQFTTDKSRDGGLGVSIEQG